MASAELSRRVGKVVGYPPLCDLSGHQRREFHEALLDADAFEDLPGKWRAAILKGRRERAQSADRRQRLAPGSSACPPADRARRSFAWMAAVTASWVLLRNAAFHGSLTLAASRSPLDARQSFRAAGGEPAHTWLSAGRASSAGLHRFRSASLLTDTAALGARGAEGYGGVSRAWPAARGGPR
jgi:hypothetical protein